MDPDIHAPLLDETSVYGAAARDKNISKQMKGLRYVRCQHYRVERHLR